MQSIEMMSRALSENLDKLTAFSAAARFSSISRAAAQIHLSQSALSHLISNLEQNIGVTLFKRKPRGLELTEEGRKLFDFSNRLLLDVDSLASRLRASQSETALNIKIGTHETLATHIWPKVIAQWTVQDPLLKLSLLSGRVDLLVEMLVQRNLHAIVTVEPKADQRLRTTPLYSGSLRFFVGSEFLIKRNKVHLKDVREISVFTDTEAHVKQGLSIRHALQQLGFDNLGQFEVSSFEAAIHLAEMNLGIALLPDRNARRAVSEKRLKPLSISGLKDQSLLNYKTCLTTCTDYPYEALHEKVFKILNRNFS